VSAAAVARAITRNTVLVVASSPCFPHGVIDDVSGIAKVCMMNDVHHAHPAGRSLTDSAPNVQELFQLLLVDLTWLTQLTSAVGAARLY
jgi:hypothetical protein